MKKKPLIYLASPYSSDCGATVLERAWKAQKATAKLIEQGKLVFSPIVHSHPIADVVSFNAQNTPEAESGWMDHDRAMIDKCDEVHVLCLEGWELSRGIQAEVEHALSKNIPVKYLDPKDLSEVGTISWHGAGNFWTPPSTGEAPIEIQTTKTFGHTSGESKFFTEPTHTTYKAGDKCVVTDIRPHTHNFEVGQVVEYTGSDDSVTFDWHNLKGMTKPVGQVRTQTLEIDQFKPYEAPVEHVFQVGSLAEITALIPNESDQGRIQVDGVNSRGDQIPQILRSRHYRKAPVEHVFQVGDKVEVCVSDLLTTIKPGEIAVLDAIDLPDPLFDLPYYISSLDGTRKEWVLESGIKPYTPEPRKIIGINGVARSGKDTIGQHLVEAHGYVRIALADAVRDAALALNPMISIQGSKADGKFTYEIEPVSIKGGEAMSEMGWFWYCDLKTIVESVGWDEAKKVEGIRSLLQKLGTEAGRKIHGEDCWINIARKKIEALPADQNVVITDIRFDNEAEFVRELGGEVWKVIRPGTEAVNGHASEQDLKQGNFDLLLPNNGTIEQLNQSVDRWLELYGK